MIYKKIREFIHKHEKLLYVQRCFRNIKDNDFVKDVLEVQTNPMVIRFETFGNMNKDKNICLYENNRIGGFFAIYRYMLNVLYFSERFHFKPVINYTSDFLYAEREEVNGTMNPFEYYFEKVSEITLEETYSSFNVVRYKMIYNRVAEQQNSYKVSDEYINNMAYITKKYIRLNSYVKPIIDNDVENMLKGKRTIGIHMRGTDFNLGFNNHPIVVTPLEYIEYVKEAILEYGFEQIFLATDDNQYLELFKNTFGDKLVYYTDVIRADDNISVAFSNSSRKYHHYILGLEVLRDMLTLANCDGLIAGLSQVSTCARITKASYERNYEYLKIIDKGIHKNNNNFNKFAKKLIKSRGKKVGA